jgi:hypothetical protein
MKEREEGKGLCEEKERIFVKQSSHDFKRVENR